MTIRISISVGETTVEGELFDTPSALTLAAKLPITAVPLEWGDEFYFPVPIDEPLDDTAAVKVNVGDIGYWPPGPALALFFGPTPASTGEEPVAASEVNIVGRVIGDATILREARGARTVTMERI